MHQENVSKRYDRANWNQSVILFGNFKEKEIEALVIQKQQSIGVPSNMCSENMHQIYRRTPMPKCDLLNLILYELYWNHKMETEILRQKACKATVDAFFEMISTKCAQHPYFTAPITRKHILKISSRRLQTMERNYPMNLVFIQKRLSRKHIWRAPRYLRPLLQTWWHYHTIWKCSQDTCGHYIYIKIREKEERDR